MSKKKKQKTVAPVSPREASLTTLLPSRSREAAKPRSREAASRKPQAASRTPQAASRKPQAASRKASLTSSFFP